MDVYSGNSPGWVWLLPLVAVPIIYFIWKGASAPEEEENYRGYNQPLAGVKGGRVSRKKGGDKSWTTKRKKKK